jgi:hypothetical protein
MFLKLVLEYEIASAINAPITSQMRGVNLPDFFLDLFFTGMAVLS